MILLPPVQCMSESTGADRASTEDDSLDAVFACMASERRRRILGFVSDRAPEPVSRGELATALAARANRKPRDEVTDEERQRAAATLRHAHLPNLAAAGLIEHDAAAGTVTLADHPAFQDPGILEVIDGDVSASPESLDGLFGGLLTLAGDGFWTCSATSSAGFTWRRWRGNWRPTTGT